MMSTRRASTSNFTVPLVLDPPRHSGLAPIALVTGRHVIGSCAACGIRLPFEGVQGSHALILVGENRTIVKSIDARTWVNDGPVSEIALRPGDRLSIGPLTFRVRSATRDEAAALPEPMPAVQPPPPLPASELHGPVSGHPVEQAAIAGVETRNPLPPMNPLPAAKGPAESGESPVIGNEPVDEPVTEAVTADSSPVPVSPGFERLESESSALESVSSAMLDSALLESRLNEIQQQLAELRRSAPAGVQADLPLPAASTVTEAELHRHAGSMAAESRELQRRMAAVADREAQVEYRQLQLAREAQRIADLAFSTRQSLADEHAQHVALWQEWESAYQRMTGELASQLNAVEQRRESLQSEADRLSAARCELQRARSEYECDRRACDEDRRRLVAETAEVETLKSQLDAERRQQRRDADELIAQLQSERQELEAGQANLLLAQKELERERHTLLAQTSAQIRRFEDEHRRRLELQSHLDEDRKQLMDEREAVKQLQSQLQRQQFEFDRERSEFAAFRVGVEESKRELQILQDRCRQAEDDLADLRRQWDAERAASARQREVEPQSAAVVPPTTTTSSSFSTTSELAGASASCLPSVPAVAGLGWAATESSGIPFLSDVNPHGDTGVSVDWGTLASAEQIDAGLPARDSTGLTATEDIPAVVPQLSEVLGVLPADVPELQAERGRSMSASAMAAHDPWGDFSTSVDSSTPMPAGYSESPSHSAADPWDVIARTAPAPQPYSPVAGESSDVEFKTDAAAVDDFANLTAFSSAADTQFAGAGEVDSVLHDQAQIAGETLAEVNREFGTPVESVAIQEPASSLPSWWVEGPAPAAERETAAGLPDFPPGMTSNPETDSADDLRSRLAMLFDLPAVSSSKADESPSESVLELPHDAAENVVAADAAEFADASSHREVNEGVADASCTSATVPEPAAAESETHSEDSVEDFMARLLARSRGETVSPVTSGAAGGGSMPVQSTLSAGGDSPFHKVEQDRSHLSAAPKHKQDKQAVRENLQSFREVAHLSARSALARHSLQQLRNATIAKGVLAGVSAVAASWFILEPVWGSGFQLWKAATCGLATLLSSIEFGRSWSQLRKPLHGAVTGPQEAGAVADDAPDAGAASAGGADITGGADAVTTDAANVDSAVENQSVAAAEMRDSAAD